MKNLATCKPSEFVAQTAKIKNAVADWTKLIGLSEIRNTQPNYVRLPDGATAEQRADVIRTNARLRQEQAFKNFNRILDKALVEHPNETLEVLALSCFVEPANVDDHTIDEYLQCIMEMAQCKGVLNFFSLLAQLEQKPTLTV